MRRLLVTALAAAWIATHSFTFSSPSSPQDDDPPIPPGCKKRVITACTSCSDPGNNDIECKSGHDWLDCFQQGPITCTNGAQCDQYAFQNPC